MSLAQLFIDYKNEYELLKTFKISKKRITNICNSLSIENGKNTIILDIEESEGYVSVLFKHKIYATIFYTLSDYSYIEGAKDIFDVFGNSRDKLQFYHEVKYCVKNQRKTRKHNIYQIKLVKLIYDLIEDYLRLYIS